MDCGPASLKALLEGFGIRRDAHRRNLEQLLFEMTAPERVLRPAVFPAQRDEAHRHRVEESAPVEAVRDPFAELGLGGEMLRQMDGIAIAGELREADHVGGGDRLRQRLGHADREVLEIKNAQRQDHQART